MKRSLKVLGLALVAVFALGAVTASSALAVNNTHHFTAGVEPSIITAHQEGTEAQNFFSTNAGKVTCKTSLYEGTVAAKTNQEITVTPTYPNKILEGEKLVQNCTAFTLPAEVITNHCAFKLTGKTDVNGHAKVEQECAAGSEIEIKVPAVGCTIKVPAQVEAKYEQGVHYIDTENVTTKKQDITVEATVKHIKYTVSNAFLCGGASGENGELKTLNTAEAFVDKKPFGPGTELTTPVGEEGAVVDLTGNTLVTET